MSIDLEVGSATPDRVLIADDSRVNRSLLRGILTRQGFEVAEAADGEAALLAARENPPELILLDIDMPRQDGFEVCSELKRHAETAQIPIIFLSSFDQSAQKIRGLELGAVDYVTKPFDRGEVLARVRTQMRVLHLTRSLREANQELLRQRQSLDDDLRAAAEIQRSLLPGSETASGLRAGWRFRPCSSIGGDMFNLIRLNSRQTACYVVDVAGHGVPSALVGMSVNHRLSSAWLAEEGEAGHVARSPSAVLRRLDYEYPIERFNRFFTIAYLVLDTVSGRLCYSCAGHPPPMLLRRDGTVERLAEGGPPIGLGEFLDFEEATVDLEADDRLILYTDGVVEAPDGAGALLGIDGLEAFVRSTSTLGPAAVCSQLEELLVRRSGKIADHDDVSFLALDWQPET